MSDSTPRKTVSQVAKEWGDDNAEYALAQINEDLRGRIAKLEAAISCADELLEMGMRELAQNELRKSMENYDGS